MNSQNTQQSTNDIQNELSEVLKKSEMDVALKKDETEDNFQEELQSRIDPKKNEFDAVYNQGVKDLTEVIQSKKLADEVCWYTPEGIRKCK
ncbi:hypothetical protein [Nostoc sp. 'Lobaria pulmonaria (5183) cyanobiont']|uniref:hypothetical protein n=1 Tax=Nostoc sp. 'Lobaria pulmonaria (5183) cyanobiont' TaxID=1618022 RepID=UPI000CF32B47|nr:hypothetical protein [Nostoc sp. 'Lobaria pulmonaria (5183) cyanobiont']AVH71849.1 hypothetical protein NLP_3289 [Nostoc sp. 'Lobaria pulmonaria (5183) cyanobiont']